MNPLYDLWRFTRVRLAQSWDGLSDGQLAWRPFEGGHNIAEYLFHVAGAEHYWASRMSPAEAPKGEVAERMDGVFRAFLHEGDFPFGAAHFNNAAVAEALAFSEKEVRPVFESPTAAQLSMRIVSPVGDDVSGYEGLTRLAQHAGYHAGQIWLLRQMPGFPER